MATNKNASFRYRVINNCLRNSGRKWSLNDLIDKVSSELDEHFGIQKGVSKRQIQEDLSIMRSLPPRGFDAPIICMDGYYSYSDSDFSIDKNPLNEKDIDSLNEALKIFKQFSGLPHFSELKQIIAKIEGAISIKEYANQNVIAFENNDNVEGIEYLDPIYKAILGKKVLEISYQPFSSDSASPLIIHPYLLKEYRNRWFCLGLNPKLNAISILALDRIKGVTPLNMIDYQENAGLNPNLYFRDIIGVTLPENKEIEIIELLLSPQLTPYILTKPLHLTQKVINKNKSGTYIQIQVIPNFELTQLLLSFGENIKVIKPKALVDEIHRKLKASAEQYN